MTRFINYSLLMAVTLFTFQNKLFGTKSYPKLQWKKLPEISSTRLPKIHADEKFTKFRNPVFAQGKVYWVLNMPNKSFGILEWNMETGAIRRPLKLKTRIRGLAFDAAKNELVLRTRRTLHFYHLKNMKLRRKESFEELKRRSWSPMQVDKNKIYTLSVDSKKVLIYSLNSLEKIDEIEIPKGKVQRLFVLPNNQLLLWSSHWGRKLKVFSLITKSLIAENRVLLYHYHGLFHSVQIKPSELAVFDLEKRKTAHLIRLRKLWINRSGAYQANGIEAYRFAPLKQKIKAHITIIPKKDIQAKWIYLAIPPQNTYNQKLENARIYSRGKLVKDKLGNIYLKLKLPSLRRGRKFELRFYSAQLTRYKTVFDLSSFSMNPSQIKAPKGFKSYLADHYTYGLKHPLVQNFYQRNFASINKTSDIIQAIYDFAVHKINGKWDGKSDRVPEILKNLHGGCTEHSRTQVAFLRLAGIPARFNWNWLGKKITKKIKFNHKYAEAWLPQLGWIPLEPLGGTRSHAGESSSYHFIFAVRDALESPYFKRYDRLAAYAGKKAYRLWKLAPIKVEWELE